MKFYFPQIFLTIGLQFNIAVAFNYTSTYNDLGTKLDIALNAYIKLGKIEILDKEIIKFGKNDYCYNSAIASSSNGLAHISHIFNLKKSSPSPFVVALLGDSVGEGCCDRRGGFGVGVKLFIEEYFNRKKDVVFKNLAHGAKSPLFNFWCSDLQGDEDLIIFQTVHLGDFSSIEAFLYDHLKYHNHHNGFKYPAIIVIFSLRRTSAAISYGTIFNSYPVPVIDMIGSFQKNDCICSQITNYTKTNIYHDSIHPNLNGHLLFALVINRVLQSALALPPLNITSSLSSSKNSSYHPLPRHFKPYHTDILSFSNRKCFHMLDDVKNGPVVIRNNGFILTDGVQRGSYRKFKRRWETTQVNASITFSLPPCQSVYVVWYQRNEARMGAAKVDIDGYDMGELNGWFPGYNWDTTRGNDGEKVLVQNLKNSIPHNITYTMIDNLSGGKNGTYFSIIGIAVANGGMQSSIELH